MARYYVDHITTYSPGAVSRALLVSQGVITYSIPHHGTIAAARRSRRKTTYTQLQEPNYIATGSQLWMLKITTTTRL